MCGGIMKTKATLAIVTLGYAIFLQLNSIYCIIWLGITLKPNVLHVTVSRCNLMLLSAIRKVSTSHGQHENKRLKFICVPKLTLIVVEFVRNKRFSIKGGFRLFLENFFEPFFLLFNFHSASSICEMNDPHKIHLFRWSQQREVNIRLGNRYQPSNPIYNIKYNTIPFTCFHNFF